MTKYGNSVWVSDNIAKASVFRAADGSIYQISCVSTKNGPIIYGID